jgi:predicted amidohydrolase
MRVACVQAGVVFGDPGANARRCVGELGGLKERGVDLAVFPECFLTGYCVSSFDGAREIAIPRGHESLGLIQEACERLDVLCVVGFGEVADDPSEAIQNPKSKIQNGAVLHNAAALFEPGKEPRYYRKTHIPELGLDKHVTAGDELPVFETRLGKIGVLICFDQRVPEAARVLALKGAELIVLPTNWPEGAETSADTMCIARAAENRVFYAACNRMGSEQGFRFIGRSKIIDPSGKVLAAAGDGEEVLVADIDLAEARVKRSVVKPGVYEWTVFECRRPKLYGELLKDEG